MEASGEHSGFIHAICTSCGFEHFYAEDSIIDATLYEEDSDYLEDLNVARNHRDLIQWCHKKAIKYLKKELDISSDKILDVGCFNGFFVKELIDIGFDAIGIDFNKKALDYGKKYYGLKEVISIKSVKELHLKGLQFEAITIFEVIEHLDDFFQLLKEIDNILKPGGLLVLSTPNSHMCWRPALDWPPHHLSRFSPKALALCIDRLGYEKIRSFEQTSSYDLLRNYVGSHFRQKNKQSLRGGQFRNKQLTNFLRQCANKSRRVGYTIFYPVDYLMHIAGVRYISQLIIARKAK